MTFQPGDQVREAHAREQDGFRFQRAGTVVRIAPEGGIVVRWAGPPAYEATVPAATLVPRSDR